MPTIKPNNVSQACPACQGELVRDWLGPIDKFFKMFTPVRRFRCCADVCRWEGRIAAQSTNPINFSADNSNDAALKVSAKVEGDFPLKH